MKDFVTVEVIYGDALATSQLSSKLQESPAERLCRTTRRRCGKRTLASTRRKRLRHGVSVNFPPPRACYERKLPRVHKITLVVVNFCPVTILYYYFFCIDGENSPTFVNSHPLTISWRRIITALSLSIKRCFIRSESRDERQKKKYFFQ